MFWMTEAKLDQNPPCLKLFFFFFSHFSFSWESLTQPNLFQKNTQWIQPLKNNNKKYNRTSLNSNSTLLQSLIELIHFIFVKKKKIWNNRKKKVEK